MATPNPLDCLTAAEKQRLMQLMEKRNRGRALTAAEVREVLALQDRIVATRPDVATSAQTAAAARLRQRVGY